MVTIRKLSATEPAVGTVLYFAIIASLVSVILLSWAWKTPTFNEWLMLITIGISSTLVQLLSCYAFNLYKTSERDVCPYGHATRTHYNIFTVSHYTI